MEVAPLQGEAFHKANELLTLIFAQSKELVTHIFVSASLGPGLGTYQVLSKCLLRDMCVCV